MRLRFLCFMALLLAGGVVVGAERVEAESACVRVKIGEDEHLECPRVWAPIYGNLRNCAPLTVDSRPMVRCPLRPRPWEKEPAVATACAQVKVGEETHLECSPFWVPIYFASLRTREEPPPMSFKIGVPPQRPGDVQDKARAAPIPALDMIGSHRESPQDPVDFQKRPEPLRRTAEAEDNGLMIVMGEIFNLSRVFEDLLDADLSRHQAAIARDHEARQSLNELYLRRAPSPPDDRTPEERMAALRALLLQERQVGNLAPSPAFSPAPALGAPTSAMLNAELADELTAQGWRYEQGLDVPQDDVRAADSYRQAAALGDTRAMLNLSRLYQSGGGVPSDFAQAERWMRAAQAAGDPRAEFTFMQLYETTSDFAFHVERLQRWAIQGDRKAMLHLAWLYEQGLGVQQDYAQATQRYRLGAELGDPLAMRSLAWLYRFGLGVPQDAALAERWRRKAGPLQPFRPWPYRPSDLP